MLEVGIEATAGARTLSLRLYVCVAHKFQCWFFLSFHSLHSLYTAHLHWSPWHNPRAFEAEVFTGQKPFLSPNQQCKCTEGRFFTVYIILQCYNSQQEAELFLR